MPSCRFNTTTSLNGRKTFLSSKKKGEKKTHQCHLSQTCKYLGCPIYSQPADKPHIRSKRFRRLRKVFEASLLLNRSNLQQQQKSAIRKEDQIMNIYCLICSRSKWTERVHTNYVCFCRLRKAKWDISKCNSTQFFFFVNEASRFEKHFYVKQMLALASTPFSNWLRSSPFELISRWSVCFKCWALYG